MKIEWFEERIGEGPYQHVKAYIRNAERDDAMMREALSESIFGGEGTGA